MMFCWALSEGKGRVYEKCLGPKLNRLKDEKAQSKHDEIWEKGTWFSLSSR